MDGDPLGSNAFDVDLGDTNVGCSEVTGLLLEPGATPAATVTLRRGVTSDRTLLEWARNPAPRRVTITVLDARNEPASRYVLLEARPIRWTGPTLNALSAAIAIEELVLSAKDVHPA
jgi:phage tail-like protein